ncbi:MAG: hypothetical protein JXA67_10040 [Micromonosporaceae bacterium]|nr:hypothetical protein [Micromonosporaceae bacterium]
MVTEPDPAETRAAAASRLALMSLVGIGGLALLWFVVSWIYLNSSPADALGEALGGVMVVVLIVSIVGSFGGQSR